MSPVVSVIIPTHNRGELLMQTVASVQAQTYRDFEAIVVDDHSTDDTIARMESILASDARFKLIRVPEGRSGAQAARNIGIEASRGAYIMLLDSDDLLAPWCLQQRVPAMQQRPDFDFLVFPCECFRNTPGDAGVLWNVPTAENDLDRFLKVDVPWQTTSPIWRRESMTALLPWPEDVPVGQDWEFHIRAIVKGMKYACVGKTDHYWRQPDPERESIGKGYLKPELLTGRAWTNQLVARQVRDAGQMSDARRDLFAGLFFQSAERIGTRISWRDAVRVWATALELELITPKQFRQGRTYFWMYRFKKLRPWLRTRLERAWPAGYFYKRSATYLKAPVPKPAEAAA